MNPSLALLRRPWIWIVIAAGARLAVLFTLPGLGATMQIHPAVLGDSAAGSYIEYLNRRTDFRAHTEDEAQYDEIGVSLAEGRGFTMRTSWLITDPDKPAMYAGCAYPLFVGAVYAITGGANQLPVYLLQIVLMSAAVWLIFETAAIVAGPLAGAVASGFYAFHPALVWVSVSMMSEAICVPLVAMAAYWLVLGAGKPGARVRIRRGAALGVVLALLCLARSTFSYFAWVIPVWLLVRETHLRPARLRRAGSALAFVLAFVTVSAPWTIRNYLHWGEFIPFSTKSGVAAWMHNHPGLQVVFGREAIFGPQPVDIFSDEIQSLPDEAARDARLMEMFRGFVRREPLRFIGLSWMRFWMALLPVSVTSDGLAAAVGAAYAKLPALLALVVGGWLCRRRLGWRLLPLLGFVACWHLLQSLAGPGLRYRLPADAVWSVLIGVAAAVAFARLAPHVVAEPLATRWLRRPGDSGRAVHAF